MYSGAHSAHVLTVTIVLNNRTFKGKKREKSCVKRVLVGTPVADTLRSTRCYACQEALGTPAYVWLNTVVPHNRGGPRHGDPGEDPPVLGVRP